MPQLNPEFFLSQIFWLAVVFSSLYFFIAYYFIPRIGTVVDKREESVKNFLDDAKRILAEQEETKRKIEEILDKARNEAAELKRATTKESELSFNKEVVKVEKEMTKKIIVAEEKLVRLKAQILKDIEKSADQIADQMMTKIFETQDLKRKKVAN
jgi:F-type H+-transporting ATPase subunit b